MLVRSQDCILKACTTILAFGGDPLAVGGGRTEQCGPGGRVHLEMRRGSGGKGAWLDSALNGNQEAIQKQS